MSSSHVPKELPAAVHPSGCVLPPKGCLNPHRAGSPSQLGKDPDKAFCPRLRRELGGGDSLLQKGTDPAGAPRRCPLGRVSALWTCTRCSSVTRPRPQTCPGPQTPSTVPVASSPPPPNRCLPPPHRCLPPSRRLLPPSLSPPLSDAPSTFRPRGGRHKPCFFQRPRLNTVSDPSWRGRPRFGNKPGRTRRAIKDAAKQKSTGYLADWL